MEKIAEMKKCPYECKCLCHSLGGLHIMACCYKCKICHRNIRIGLMDAHLRECHKKEDEKCSLKCSE